MISDCQNITVTLKNDAFTKHNGIQGVYHYFGVINGKSSWILPSTEKAIWYLPQLPTSDWGIGNYADIGTKTRQITSSGDQSDRGPADVPLGEWWYYNEKNYEWIHGGDDIIVKCAYSTMEEIQPVFGGMQSNEEVCFAFITYAKKDSRRKVNLGEKDKNQKLQHDFECKIYSIGLTIFRIVYIYIYIYLFIYLFIYIYKF